MLIGHSFSDADGVIVAIDQPVCDFLGRARPSLIGASYLDITHPDDKPENLSKISSLQPGEILLMTKRYILPDGSAIAAEMHVSRFETVAGSTRLIGSISSPQPLHDLRSPARVWAAARKALHGVSLRKEMLGGLHSDFAWEIILHIYLAEAEGRAIRREDVGRLIGQSARTTERWIDLLHHQEVIDHDPDRADLLQMSGIGLRKTEGILLA